MLLDVNCLIQIITSHSNDDSECLFKKDSDPSLKNQAILSCVEVTYESTKIRAQSANQQ